MKTVKNDARQKKQECADTCLDDAAAKLIRASYYDNEVTDFVTTADDGHLISAPEVMDWVLKAKTKIELKRN